MSAPEFTGELVVAKLVEQLGLDAPDELAFARAAIDGRSPKAPLPNALLSGLSRI